MSEPMQKQKILNVPNALTMLRMALIPVYWVLMMNGQPHPALAVYIVASLTDLADGYIARKYNLITDFGKLMDPLADKLMVFSVMLSLVLTDAVPLWPLIVVGCKELLMVLGGLVMLKKGIVVYANYMGKIAQTVMVISLLLAFFKEQMPMLAGIPLHHGVLYLAVVLTLTALCVYAWSAVKKVKALPKA